MPKIIQYRNKCIGCGVCVEQQPELWRMSRKDGKATLIHAHIKRDIHVLSIPFEQQERSGEVAELCPVRIIKVN